MNTERDTQERVLRDPLLPRARDDGRPPTLGALGEGLLEVGIDPELGDDRLGRGFGGDAANVAVMAARMGVRTVLLTRVGEDPVGRLLMDFWHSRGVEVSLVETDGAAPTGLYVNDGLDPGRHSFAYYRSRSAASRLGAGDLGREAIEGLDLLYLSGITLSISDSAAAAADAAVDLAREAGAVVAFDINFRHLLDADPEAILAMARRADVVLLANADAEAVIGTSAPREVLDALGPLPREVLITHGGEEAHLFTREASFSLAPPSVEVVNAAGAGDAVAGAYLASRLRGVEAAEALALAVSAGSISCGRGGCARGYPGVDEVRRTASTLRADVHPPVHAMFRGRDRAT